MAFGYNEDLPKGSYRQQASRALIFPVHPKELEAQKNRDELKKELQEVKALKEELIKLKEDLSETK